MKPRFEFETKLLAALAAAVLVVILLAAITWKMSQDSIDAAIQVSRVHETSDSIAHARGDTLLLEASTRAYVISGDAAGLAERDAALSALETSLRRIKALTAGDARQQARWMRLREAADARIATAGRSVLLRATEGFEAARAYNSGAEIRETRARVLQLLREMEEAEERMLEERTAAQSRARQIMVATGALAALVLIALLSATYVLILRQLRATEVARGALEREGARIKSILDTVADGIITIDERGSIGTFNPAAERIFGYAAAEVVGRNVNMLMPEPYRGEHDGYLERYGASGEARIIGRRREVTGRCKDGSTCSMELLVTEMRQDGERHFTAAVRDITERKRAEAQLQLQAAALDAAANSIVITDRDGTILWVNRAFSTLTGYSAEEAIGQSPRLLKSGVQDAEFYRGMYQTILAGGVWQGEVVNRYKDGRLGTELMTITPLHGDDGGITHFIAIKQNITERKRAEEKLRAQSEEIVRKNAELEQANLAKSDFLANMSHELRTPLNSIIGFSEMLKDGVLGALEAKQRGFVTDIFDAGTHLLSLINDILDLSKVEAGAIELEAGAVDVAALLKASTLVVREKAHANRIRLDTRLDPALGSMLADERKVKQIVYNLLANAIKFTPEGGAVTLSARRCTRAEVVLDEAMPARLIALAPGENGEFLAIVVEDSGVGIAEEDLQKLFEPFTQVDSSISRRHAGAGLGLALVRRLVELHGGTVGVASRPGAGSRFCVWLPWREAPAAQEGRMAPEVTAPSGPALPLALVIEDDDRMADLIAAQLRIEGFSVMRAATAEEGLVRAAKRRPQLITLDLFLPVMDGWEFLRRMKTDPKLADTPVVIISMSDRIGAGIALGARRVLHKPFAPEELMAALAGLVEARPNDGLERVLVVDDNVQTVELLATALEAEGYRVMRAYSGAEAVAVVRSERPDLIVLDLMMPQMSGFEVAQVLRDSEQTARIPILVLTAKDLSAAERARLNDTVGVIRAKTGFSTSDLLIEVRRALPKRAGD